MTGVCFAKPVGRTVKIAVLGFKEGEIRVLFEKYAEGITESEHEFKSRLVKLRAPLGR